MLLGGLAAADVSPPDSSGDATALPRELAASETRDRGARDLQDALAAMPALDRTGDTLWLDGVNLQRWLVRWDGIPLLRAENAEDNLRSLPVPQCLAPTLHLARGPQAGAPDALAGIIDLDAPETVLPFGGRICSELRGGGVLAGRGSMQLATRSRSWHTLVAGFVDGSSADPSAGGILGRADISLGQQGSAGLHVLQTSWQDGHRAISRQLFSLHSTMQLAPQHLLRFRWTRQNLFEQHRGDDDLVLRTGETGFDVAYEGELVEHHALEAHAGGRVADRTQARPSLSTVFVQRAVFGAWVRDHWTIRANLDVEGVLSVDLDDAVGALPAGHAVLRYSPAQALVLRGRIGTATRAPGLSERAERPARSFLWPDLAPTALRPEQAQGLDVSLGVEPSWDLAAHLGLFSLELRDLLVPADDGSGATRNGGLESLQGIYLDAQALSLPGGLALWLGYQWMWNARDEWRERALDERMTHQFRLAASWDIRSLGSHLFASSDLGLAAGAPPGRMPDAGVHVGVRQRLFGRLDVVLAAMQQRSATPDEAPLPRREIRAGISIE
ncbi:MAG: TonB-dependent receptor [Pseudomonadota bacterium]